MNIKQASEYTGISRDMIRFYEKKGIIHPTRRENGYRDYTTHDLLLLVTARQYSCLGIELNTIAELAAKQDPVFLLDELHHSVMRLEEETNWLSQRLFSASYMEQTFRMIQEGSEYQLVPHGPFIYYPRSDFHHFASLYAYHSARPVFRIQNQSLQMNEYPNEQGMVFQKPVKTDLPAYSYAEGTFLRFLISLPPDTEITSSVINPFIQRAEALGHTICGDAFVSMIMGDPEHIREDVVVVEFEVES
ncbi:MAG: MerR family transcriptional regulator [Solobacterium sp.]|nr:MerR family transcriptional regulator [Solobacterium sp.]